MKMLSILIVVLANFFTMPAFAHKLLTGSVISHSWTENTFPQTWPTPKFETYICDEKTLVWNNITDLNRPTSGIETYHVVELAPRLLQVSWKESPETTNYGVIWTLDFNNMVIRGVLVNLDTNVNYEVSGIFSQRHNLNDKLYLKSCI